MAKISTVQYRMDIDWKAKLDEHFFDQNETRLKIEHFVEKLTTKKGNHFKVKKVRRTKKLALHASLFGTNFLDALNNTLVVNKILRFENQKNPHVKVFLENIEISGLEQFPEMLCILSDVELFRWVAVLNNCVAKIRYDLKNPDIQEKLASKK